MKTQSIFIQTAIEKGREAAWKAMPDPVHEHTDRVVGTLVQVLHYADSLGLDPIALSRMAEMHFIDEREGGEG